MCVYHFVIRQMGQDLKVKVENKISCMLGGKSRIVVVRRVGAPNGGAIFKKEGNDLVLIFPTAS